MWADGNVCGEMRWEGFHLLQWHLLAVSPKDADVKSIVSQSKMEIYHLLTCHIHLDSGQSFSIFITNSN